MALIPMEEGIDFLNDNVAYSIKTINDSTKTSFDDIVQYGNGLYSINLPNASSAPDNTNTYWYVLQMCFYTSNDYAIQIASSSNKGDAKLYMRKRSNTGWGSWVNVTMS